MNRLLNSAVPFKIGLTAEVGAGSRYCAEIVPKNAAKGKRPLIMSDGGKRKNKEIESLRSRTTGEEFHSDWNGQIK